MNYIILILFSLIVISFFYYRNIKKNFHSINPINRLKGKFNSNKKVIEKSYQSISDHLMLSPEENIEIRKGDREEDLIEKANIHRARLSKYRKSRLGGITYYKGSRGGVYMINKKGKKKYI